MVLEEEWEDLFTNSMEIRCFNGLSCQSSNEDDININCIKKERQRWSRSLNAAVIGCYFLSRLVDEESKPVTEYRMYNIWKEQYCTEITEQCFCDQARMIRKMSGQQNWN